MIGGRTSEERGDVIWSGMAGVADFVAVGRGVTSAKRALRAHKRFYRLLACG
jgi:orotidine-5'-phosphate decarboxylase